MKHKADCLLREVAGEYIVLPTGLSAVDFSGMITLSESSAFVWKLLDEERSYDELLAAVLAEYEVDPATAAADLRGLLARLHALGLLEIEN